MSGCRGVAGVVSWAVGGAGTGAGKVVVATAFGRSVGQVTM